MGRFEPAVNFESGIERQREFKTAMIAQTTLVQKAAVVIAKESENTGYYRRRIRRRGARVHSGDPFWHLSEFGSVNNSAYSPLRRGVIATGLRFEPAPSEL